MIFVRWASYHCKATDCKNFGVGPWQIGGLLILVGDVTLNCVIGFTDTNNFVIYKIWNSDINFNDNFVNNLKILTASKLPNCQDLKWYERRRDTKFRVPNFLQKSRSPKNGILVLSPYGIDCDDELDFILDFDWSDSRSPGSCNCNCIGNH